MSTVLISIFESSIISISIVFPFSQFKLIGLFMLFMLYFCTNTCLKFIGEEWNFKFKEICCGGILCWTLELSFILFIILFAKLDGLGATKRFSKFISVGFDSSITPRFAYPPKSKLLKLKLCEIFELIETFLSSFPKE